ncbi:MAG TPA: argininosuccinate lyase [Firmicutes bacterium]|nr:argininosuccinate lyase [Bacillota bacterium]
MKKTWQGRFKKKMNADADAFNSSVSFDRRLFQYDIKSCEAHAKALLGAGVIKKKEADEISAGLKKLLKKEEKIDFEKYEDVHSAVEMELVKITGPVGKKIHTGRSRNDLVSTDTRQYLKDEIREIEKLLKKLMKAVLGLAKKNINTYMPGYTHLQQAQVVSAAHWLMSYFEMFKRDLQLVQFVLIRTDIMTLGSGALAGSNYALDRKAMARELCMGSIAENSMDAVSDRDFVMDFLYFNSMAAMHLSRLAEEIIIYNTSEFGYIEIDDSFATGSSIMPQKKNPDIAELLRGKTGKSFGRLMAGLTMMKGLPQAYNKDLQEDKVLLFEAVDEIKTSLDIAGKLMKNIRFNCEKIDIQLENKFMYAVDIADYLVGKGIAFRDAHEITGKLVACCLEKKIQPDSLSEEELSGISPLLEKDILKIFDPGRSTGMKKTSGSASAKSVIRQIVNGEKIIK